MKGLLQMSMAIAIFIILVFNHQLQVLLTPFPVLVVFLVGIFYVIIAYLQKNMAVSETKPASSGVSANKYGGGSDKKEGTSVDGTGAAGSDAVGPSGGDG